MKIEGDAAKRAKAAGKASAKKRRERLEAVLAGMESLIARNPDFARR
jgi:hypothetical protein